MKKLLKVVNSLLFIFLICFMVYMLISSYHILKLTKILIILCIFPLVMVPYILDKIKLYHMDEIIIFFYYLFLLLSLVLGCVLDFYDKIWWFDLFAHFISGIFTGVVSFILLQENHIIKNDNKVFCIVFMIMFVIGIAAGWEYFEFICDKILGGDAQKVASGVDDTMTDMLIATLGGIFVSIYYVYYIRKKNSGGSKNEKTKKEKRLE